ncbi:unnamed protein product [Amoebophrya sp. A120]|nr:unnamed protein product [Amoebophrya sp. A120]|eukprot:GSA120T00003763001.1
MRTMLPLLPRAVQTREMKHICLMNYLSRRRLMGHSASGPARVLVEGRATTTTSSSSRITRTAAGATGAVDDVEILENNYTEGPVAPPSSSAETTPVFHPLEPSSGSTLHLQDVQAARRNRTTSMASAAPPTPSSSSSSSNASNSNRNCSLVRGTGGGPQPLNTTASSVNQHHQQQLHASMQLLRRNHVNRRKSSLSVATATSLKVLLEQEIERQKKRSGSNESCAPIAIDLHHLELDQIAETDEEQEVLERVFAAADRENQGRCSPRELRLLFRVLGIPAKDLVEHFNEENLMLAAPASSPGTMVVQTVQHPTAPPQLSSSCSGSTGGAQPTASSSSHQQSTSEQQSAELTLQLNDNLMSAVRWDLRQFERWVPQDLAEAVVNALRARPFALDHPSLHTLCDLVAVLDSLDTEYTGAIDPSELSTICENLHLNPAENTGLVNLVGSPEKAAVSTAPVSIDKFLQTLTAEELTVIHKRLPELELEPGSFRRVSGEISRAFTSSEATSHRSVIDPSRGGNFLMNCRFSKSRSSSRTSTNLQLVQTPRGGLLHKTGSLTADEQLHLADRDHRGSSKDARSNFFDVLDLDTADDQMNFVLHVFGNLQWNLTVGSTSIGMKSTSKNNADDDDGGSSLLHPTISDPGTMHGLVVPHLTHFMRSSSTSSASIFPFASSSCSRQPPPANDATAILREVRLAETGLRQYCSALRLAYIPNAYHNYHHALNTLHLCSQYLSGTKSAGKTLLYSLEVLTCLCAALAHDVGHRGFTNPFEVATGSELAIFYNDNSVLENMHASVGFSHAERFILPNLFHVVDAQAAHPVPEAGGASSSSRSSAGSSCNISSITAVSASPAAAAERSCIIEAEQAEKKDNSAELVQTEAITINTSANNGAVPDQHSFSKSSSSGPSTSNPVRAGGPRYEKVGREVWRRFRKIFIESILGTDMVHHEKQVKAASMLATQRKHSMINSATPFFPPGVSNGASSGTARATEAGGASSSTSCNTNTTAANTKPQKAAPSSAENDDVVVEASASSEDALPPRDEDSSGSTGAAALEVVVRSKDKEITSCAKNIRSSVINTTTPTRADHSTSSFHLDETGRSQLVELVLHTADIGNGCQPLSVALRWKDRILEEFSNQAAEEAKVGIPVTPFMLNLHDPIVAAKSQIAFVGFVVAPLMQIVSPLLGLDTYMECMYSNTQYYQDIVNANNKLGLQQADTHNCNGSSSCSSSGTAVSGAAVATKNTTNTNTAGASCADTSKNGGTKTKSRGAPPGAARTTTKGPLSKTSDNCSKDVAPLALEEEQEDKVSNADNKNGANSKATTTTTAASSDEQDAVTIYGQNDAVNHHQENQQESSCSLYPAPTGSSSASAPSSVTNAKNYKVGQELEQNYEQQLQHDLHDESGNHNLQEATLFSRHGTNDSDSFDVYNIFSRHGTNNDSDSFDVYNIFDSDVYNIFDSCTSGEENNSEMNGEDFSANSPMLLFETACEDGGGMLAAGEGPPGDLRASASKRQSSGEGGCTVASPTAVIGMEDDTGAFICSSAAAENNVDGE